MFPVLSPNTPPPTPLSCRYTGDPDVGPAVSRTTANTMAENAALKLPEFWESAPEAWFVQVEAQFGLRSITDDEKRFWHVVTALNSRTASQVVRLITSPPPHNKYGALKDHLLRVHGLSRRERARRLLDINGLGERTPTQLMDYMLNMLGEEEPGSLFMELYQRQLPPHVRTALGNSDISNPRIFAEEAERYFTATPRAAHEHVAPVQVSSEYLAPVQTTHAQVDQRRKQKQQNQQKGWCSYHARYGAKAHSCRKPCTYVASGNDVARPL